ncbi:putative glycoside hydrolase [Paenibacillus eucommiae]|uniref:DUF4015 domain-containing protein n=1 Tax=Paenibacillus eucommiae TaxID=1355755 RepID=A0ABS4IY57_9BACL|nr:putative glycoside hydrolase [Paenibacillus eucommiae]MBP1992490.1 hypothetical protein [Paenibacillus eucommiae]
MVRKMNFLRNFFGLIVILFLGGLFLTNCSNGGMAVRQAPVSISSPASSTAPQITKMLKSSQDAPAAPAAQVAPESLVLPPPSPASFKKGAYASSKHQKVKGIYVSAWSLTSSKFPKLLELMDATDLNAMVIDLKTDAGQVTYRSSVPMVGSIGANSNVIISDIKGKIKQLKDKHIYTIARIVVFKDPYLSIHQKDYALKEKSGKVWLDPKGVAWVDPYKEKVWEYNIQIAKEAVQLGFDEIQFDYVRFPENGKRLDQEVRFDNEKGWSKAQVIEAFLKKAKEEVGAYISADVFGLTTSSKDDMGIGQDWMLISKEVDVISPMIYPSHYSRGVYNIENPDLQPYAVVNKAVADANKKNDQLYQAQITPALIRPWFQDFTATWVHPHKKYGLLDVKEQIKAAHELGIEEFLLWNSGSSYSYQ